MGRFLMLPFNKKLLIVPVFLVALITLLPGTAMTDSISDAEDVPATSAEKQFIARVVEHVKVSAPAPEGWSREVSVRASGNTVREGKPVMIFERARNFPLKINIQLNFKQVTAAAAKRVSAEKSAQELQQEMMTAINAGDMEKVTRLQQQLAVMMQTQMTAGAMGQAVGVSPMASAEKPAKFHVQVIVNGDGESIGKEYDMEAPGVTKAFRVDKGAEKSLSYKYYIGAWEVSQLDKRNWRIVSPEGDQTTANHLKALVAKVNVYGDRKSVESYVKGSLNLNGLNSVLN